MNLLNNNINIGAKVKVNYELINLYNEDKKSLESIIKFYNKYDDLIYSTKLKFIYIKNNKQKLLQ